MDLCAMLWDYLALWIEIKWCPYCLLLPGASINIMWAGGHIGLIIIAAHVNFISVVEYSPVSLFAFPDII